MVAVQFNGDFGQLTIYNIYNDCNNSETIAQLGACHGLSPDLPYPSEASLLPPMVGPISNAFRSTSDPTGSSAYFSLSLMDSRMFLLAFFT